MHLQPAAGRRVVDPATRQPLPPEGLQLAPDSPHATYWQRRLAEGDVVAQRVDVAVTPVKPVKPVQATSTGSRK